MLLLITISIFVCITLGMIGVYWFFTRPQSAATERLKRMGGSAASSAPVSISLTEENATDKLAERISTPLNRLVPVSAGEVQKLQKKLMQAGFRSHHAPLLFRAIQLLTMAAFPAIVALTCAILARPLMSALF